MSLINGWIGPSVWLFQRRFPGPFISFGEIGRTIVYLQWKQKKQSKRDAILLMVYSYCTGTGLATGQGSVSINSNILCKNVHSDSRRGQGPGPLLSYCASSGSCTAVLCNVKDKTTNGQFMNMCNVITSMNA